MSDIFENDIDSENDLTGLEDSEDIDLSESQENYVYNFPLYRLKLEYSCEGIYANVDEDSDLEFNAGDYAIVPTRYVKVFQEKVSYHKLDMKLISTHFLIDEQKALFFFSADNRVDFRELVKDLVSVFRMRIELRQVGVRDESRITGGLGVCGRPYCCHCVSDKLRPVSIRMAKEQNLSLNSMKISGQCGRLLCCLSYEFDFYSEARKKLPPEGLHIFYDGTNFRITEVNPLTSMIKMSGDDGRLIEVNANRFSKENNRWKIV